MEQLGVLFREIFKLWDKPFNMPIVGTTSLLKLEVALAVLGLVFYLISRILGGNKSDD